MPTYERTDSEIEYDVIDKFKLHWDIPDEKISVRVETGWVTLEGNIHWNYQKQTATNVAGDVKGVRGVTNNILTVSYNS